jgi:phosphatidylserine/phosphatidylglycerophosphate/cardiolipin synthase-like enzyme
MKYFRRPINCRLSSLAALLLAFSLLPPAVPALAGRLDMNTARAERQQISLADEMAARVGIDHQGAQEELRKLGEPSESEALTDSAIEAVDPYLLLSGLASLNPKKRQGESEAPLAVPTSIFTTAPEEIILLRDAAYHEALLHLLREARHRVDLSMFIFKITGSPQNRPAHIMRELIAAKTRGVEVNVLLERSERYEDLSGQNQKVADLLKDKGVKVTFADPRRTNHTKLIVIDGRYSFVGSHNLTHAALAHNNELSLLIDSRGLAAELLDYIAGLRQD